MLREGGAVASSRFPVRERDRLCPEELVPISCRCFLGELRDAFLQRRQVHQAVRVVLPADAERQGARWMFAVGCWLSPFGLGFCGVMVDRRDGSLILVSFLDDKSSAPVLD